MQPKSIYVMKSSFSPMVKVGVSQQPEKRLNILSSSSGLPLKILYRTDLIKNSYRIESMVIEHFKEHNTKGEWFTINPKEIINYIESLISEFEVSEEIIPRHKEIRPNYIKEVENLPVLDEVLAEGFVGVVHYKYKNNINVDRYYIKYSHKKYDIIIETEFKDIALYYAFKLEKFSHNLTKYITDEQNR